MSEFGKALPFVAFWLALAAIVYFKVALDVDQPLVKIDCPNGYAAEYYRYGATIAECVKLGE